MVLFFHTVSNFSHTFLCPIGSYSQFKKLVSRFLMYMLSNNFKFDDRVQPQNTCHIHFHFLYELLSSTFGVHISICAWYPRIKGYAWYPQIKESILFYYFFLIFKKVSSSTLYRNLIDWCLCDYCKRKYSIFWISNVIESNAKSNIKRLKLQIAIINIRKQKNWMLGVPTVNMSLPQQHLAGKPAKKTCL